MSEVRSDGRGPMDLRPISIELNVQPSAAGSVLIRWGGTHVICAASIENRVPSHRLDSGGGWLTAEYAMLPASSGDRIRRERKGVGGRTAEIQRLIGRSSRAVFDLEALGARTVRLDCDVLNADGGTRCASITGSYIAACIALHTIRKLDNKPFVLPTQLAAVSVGIVGEQVVSDLCYVEDSSAEVDLNFVASPTGIVEVQGTAEGSPFSRAELNTMLDYAQASCDTLFGLQREILAQAGVAT